MIRIAAVDDEWHVLERFGKMTADRKELELCGLFESGARLLEYMGQNPLDAVFLDVEMPGTNGLELFGRILEINPDVEIIFMTAFRQYAVEAFDLHATDYILKPLTEERLEKTISRLQKNRKYGTGHSVPFVQCIGEFEVFLNGDALTWKNSKAKELLAYLVYKEGVPVSWEKIADALWPDFDAEKAQSNFHATSYLLRKRLSEVGISGIIEGGRGNYKIVKDRLECDIYRLEELIRDNRMNRKDDRLLLEKLMKNGYMEGNGYEWSYSKSIELEEDCRTFASFE